MLLRMLRRSLARNWTRKALAVLVVAIGTGLVVGMLNVSMGITDKVNRELRSYGANIVVTPKGEADSRETVDMAGAGGIPLARSAYLQERDLPRLKTIFWANNIVGFAPYLEGRATVSTGTEITLIGTWFEQALVTPSGETMTTGLKDIKSWWDVEGQWPSSERGSPSEAYALVGERLARKLGVGVGETVDLVLPRPGKPEQRTVVVSGIVSAGGDEDSQMFVPLSWLQQATNREGRIAKIEVSALTMPKNDLARKAEENLDSLTSDEFETWYCSPYVDSVAYQIEEAIPGSRAAPLRQIAEAENNILDRIRLLMISLAVAAVIGSALAISSLMGAAAMERSKEIGLLKALGAGNSGVLYLFMLEAVVIGLAGGVLGFGLGLGIGQFIALNVFDTGIPIDPLSLPAAFGVAVGMALMGSLSVARIISRLDPSQTLNRG